MANPGRITNQMALLAYSWNKHHTRHILPCCGAFLLVLSQTYPQLPGMQNTTIPQSNAFNSAVDSGHFEDLPHEVVELIAGQADGSTLKALRLVNRLVKAIIPKPFAVRLFGNFNIRTTPQDLRNALQLQGDVDFTQYARKIQLWWLKDFKNEDEVAGLLQVLLNKSIGLKSICIRLDRWPSGLSIEQRRHFTSTILRAIQDASLPTFREFNIWGGKIDIGAIQACIEVHKGSLPHFEYTCTMGDHTAWDKCLQTISESRIESLRLEENGHSVPAYLSAVTGRESAGIPPVKLVEVVRAPGSNRIQTYHIFGTCAHLRGREAVRAGIAVILGARGRMTQQTEG